MKVYRLDYRDELPPEWELQSWMQDNEKIKELVSFSISHPHRAIYIVYKELNEPKP